MVKNKKFVVMLAIFLLGALLLTGCGDGSGGETELDGEPGVTGSADEEEAVDEGDNTAPADEEKAVGEEETATADEDEAAEAQSTATASGTLKAVDAADGTVTIADKSGDELVLKVTDESKIIVGESLSNLAELATKIDSEVIVKYHAETKTVTAIGIEG